MFFNQSSVVKHVLVIGLLWGLLFSACSDSSSSSPGSEPVGSKEIVIPDVRILSTDSLLHRKNGVLFLGDTAFSGMLVEVYDGGATKSRTPYFNGREQGVAWGWYPDGTKMFEREYNAGKREGMHYGWWENGTLKFKYQFRNDLNEGEAQDWFPDGRLYKDGRESGHQQMWNEDGSVQANYVVVKGRRYGSIGSKPCTSNVDTIPE